MSSGELGYVKGVSAWQYANGAGGVDFHLSLKQVSVTDATTSLVSARLFEVAGSEPDALRPVLMPYALSTEDFGAVQAVYGEFDIRPLMSVGVENSLWEAHRLMAVNYAIMRASENAGTLNVIADAFFQVATRSMRNVHLELPAGLSAVADAAHQRARTAFIAATRGSHAISVEHGFHVSSTVLGDHLMDRAFQVCTARHTVCAGADAVVVDLSLYDLSVSDVAARMRESGASVAHVFLPAQSSSSELGSWSVGSGTGVTMAAVGGLNLYTYSGPCAGVSAVLRERQLAWLDASECLAVVGEDGVKRPFRLTVGETIGPFTHCVLENMAYPWVPDVLASLPCSCGCGSSIVRFDDAFVPVNSCALLHPDLFVSSDDRINPWGTAWARYREMVMRSPTGDSGYYPFKDNSVFTELSARTVFFDAECEKVVHGAVVEQLSLCVDSVAPTGGGLLSLNPGWQGGTVVPFYCQLFTILYERVVKCTRAGWKISPAGDPKAVEAYLNQVRLDVGLQDVLEIDFSLCARPFTRATLGFFVEFLANYGLTESGFSAWQLPVDASLTLSDLLWSGFRLSFVESSIGAVAWPFWELVFDLQAIALAHAPRSLEWGIVAGRTVFLGRRRRGARPRCIFPSLVRFDGAVSVEREFDIHEYVSNMADAAVQC